MTSHPNVAQPFIGLPVEAHRVAADNVAHRLAAAGVTGYIANPPLMSSTTPVTKPAVGEAR